MPRAMTVKRFKALAAKAVSVREIRALVLQLSKPNQTAYEVQLVIFEHTERIVRERIG